MFSRTTRQPLFGFHILEMPAAYRFADQKLGPKLTASPGHITGISYDIRSNPTQVSYGNGASETRSYDPARGRLDRIDVLDAALVRLDRTDYIQLGHTRMSKAEGTDTTLYFGPVEIRKFGQGTAEEILLYPHPNVRITHNADTPPQGEASYLHTDQLGSVRVVTDDLGALAKETIYRPFGEAVEFVTSLTPPETKGFIGERFDAGAGLQFLNARYYDPALHLFTQPDWFEVTAAGVGTNRYAYSFNDPVNKLDPGGNNWRYQDFDNEEEADGYFSKQAGDLYSRADKIRNSDSLWDKFRDAIGIDEEMIGYGDQHAARVGLSTAERRALDNGEIAQIVFEGVIAGGLAKGLGRPTTRTTRPNGFLDDVRPGSIGAQRVWTTSSRIKYAELPSTGRIRFVPRKGYRPENPLKRGQNNGYIDRFGNEWVKGPSRTKGQAFEWDVQLSRTGRNMLGWASRDGSHHNISLNGRITHR